jgi:hypothetical protein
MGIKVTSSSLTSNISFDAVNDVTSSWGAITSSAEIEATFADAFFRNIIECIFFAKHEREGLEKRSSMSHVDDKNDSNPLFKIKSQMFVQMISVVIDMLGPDLVPMQEVLGDLGARHYDYGVMEGDYDVIGDALLMTLKAHLKNEWSEHMEQSWRSVYNFMATVMVDGCREEEVARKKGRSGGRNLKRMSIPPRHRKLQLDNDALAVSLKQEGKGLLGMMDRALAISEKK